jgi:aminoglycoside phosphotransferase (APT) family kinase protein
MNSEFLTQLQAELLAVHGPQAQIDNVQRMSTGWESDIYVYHLRYSQESESQKRVIRIFQGNGADNKAITESTIISTLHQLAYPVPQVFHHKLSAESPFGTAYLILEHIPGGLFGSRLLNADEAERFAIFDRFARLYVDLHQLDWQKHLAYPYADPSPYGFIRRHLMDFQATCQNLIPEFMPICEWAIAHHETVPCSRLSILHGDFHPWNVMEKPNSDLMVIDWSGFELGDWRYDVFFTWIILSTEVNPTLGDEFLAAYQRVSGNEIAAKSYYQVAALVRRIITIYISLKFGAETMGMRQEMTTQLRNRIGVVQNMLDQLVELTQVNLSEVERFLKDFQ